MSETNGRELKLTQVVYEGAIETRDSRSRVFGEVGSARKMIQPLHQRRHLRFTQIPEPHRDLQLRNQLLLTPRRIHH